MKLKLKSLLLGALATTALFVSSGASANGNNPNLYLGLNSNGTLSFGITIGQPRVVVRQVVQQPVRYHQPHRNWRPVVRHQRPHWRPVVRHQRPNYRPTQVIYYQPARPQHYRGDGHRH